MNFDLTGKSALVTGSSKGIGRAIAEALHAEGCRVALNGRNASDLAFATSHLHGAIGIVGDVTQPQEAYKIVTEAVARFGGLDILVCNVGSGRSVPPGNETPEEWQRVFALNLWSATNTIEAAKEALMESKGVIVCISSICGLEVDSRGAYYLFCCKGCPPCLRTRHCTSIGKAWRANQCCGSWQHLV